MVEKTERQRRGIVESEGGEAEERRGGGEGRGGEEVGMTRGKGRTREEGGERGWIREKKFRPKFAI